MPTQCDHCGEALSEKNRFCPSCGRPADSETFATQTVTNDSGPKRPSTHTSSARAREGRFPPGALLAGRYRIVALLGKGGMGEVYRADDLTLDQPVALKFLPEALSRHPEAIARFRNEVRTARQVSHPNVCRVYDIGEIEGLYVLSMEYVDGEDLASLLRRIGRLPADKALEISRKLCAGLAAAHEKGVLHRDLKPSNIMLDSRGQVLLTDFGLAGLAGEIEGAEIRNGTPAYMAPEQLAGDEVTIRSDIYSLGLVLYEIFTGKLPFESDTLVGLMRARSESNPVSPATLVRDLDPMVERVILRCLQAKPGLRPGSALSVAAALPGGDPLAAALAAGETPSPEMVAAAGEGIGLSARAAVSLFAVVLAIMAVTFFFRVRESALEKFKPSYSSEVLAQKARDIVQRLGYNAQPADEATSFDWNGRYIDSLDEEKPKPNWNTVLGKTPGALRFWYRQADAPLFPQAIHDDLLTPGLMRTDDPPPTEVGMVYVILESTGVLAQFEAQPPQQMEVAKTPPPAPDWTPLFAAANIDSAKLKPADPLWNWIEAADTRVAWTGVWPGSTRPLRVEAGSVRGKPTYFKLMGNWTVPWRNAEPEQPLSQQIDYLILSGLMLMVFLAAPWLARKNLAAGRGDKRGAFRLAVFVLIAELAIWLCRGHMPPSLGLFGLFALAVVVAVFYGVVAWTVYLAAEPYVRRRWPQSLISWTSVLGGHVRDPIVGRDILIGVLLGVSLPLINALININAAGTPVRGSLTTLNGFRATLGDIASQGPRSIRDALVFVFLIFLLRVLLRNQWLAGAAFALVLTGLEAHGVWWIYIIGFVIYALFALIMLRWGLLAMAVQTAVNGILSSVQPCTNPGAWYFGPMMLLLATVLVLAVWGFRTSMGGRRLWNFDLGA